MGFGCGRAYHDVWTLRYAAVTVATTATRRDSDHMSVVNTLDPQHAAKALQKWYEDRAKAGEPVRVTDAAIPKSTGMSNETVLFTLIRDGARPERLAARVSPAGPGLFPDYDLDRERRVMRALGERSTLPVPRIRGYQP